jgi:hypothetical protein
MLISELTFPHLLAEREARLTRELERRRVVLERLDDATVRPARTRTRRTRAVSSERMPRAGVAAAAPRPADACST